MNPYSRLTEIMEERGAALNGYDMVMATVAKVSPMEIIVGKTPISVNLYCNPSLVLGLNPGGIATDEGALKECLTSFYQAFKLKPGDQVLVQQIKINAGAQVKNIFYILCKVVKV